MKINGKEYLQIGYNEKVFLSVYNEDYERINKTCVDPQPDWNKEEYPEHHIFHESFIDFSRYIPNTYDYINFVKAPTVYEVSRAINLLADEGEVVLWIVRCNKVPNTYGSITEMIEINNTFEPFVVYQFFFQ